MIVFEGVLAAIVGVALLAALVQFSGLGPTSAGAAQTIAQPTVVEPIYVKWATVNGSISLRKSGGQLTDAKVTPADSFSYSKNGLKIKCPAIKVSAFDAAGKTVASTQATNGAEPGTCSYSLRIPADMAVTLGVTDGGTGALWSLGGTDKGVPGSTVGDKHLPAWSVVTADKWKILGNGADKYIKMMPDTSQTVPLSISI